MTEADVRRLLSKHPLYDPKHRVHVRDRRYVGWGCGNRPDRSSGFSLQVDGDVCYLLTIGIVSSRRGQGLGLLLYRIIEEIALEFGCTRIQQMPSGWTPSGETRGSWLVRKLGYVWDAAHNEVYKTLGGTDLAAIHENRSVS